MKVKESKDYIEKLLRETFRKNTQRKHQERSGFFSELGRLLQKDIQISGFYLYHLKSTKTKSKTSSLSSLQHLTNKFHLAVSKNEVKTTQFKQLTFLKKDFLTRNANDNETAFCYLFPCYLALCQQSLLEVFSWRVRRLFLRAFISPISSVIKIHIDSLQQ